MKIKRQSKIIEIIKNNDIETQEELADKLRAEGFLVTQATVSRDIRELNLSKIATPAGTQKYIILNPSDTTFLDKLYRIFRDAVVSMDYAQNIVVIKTLDGMAMAVAAALDAMGKPEVVGTIAGDDNIFCVLKSEGNAITFIEKLNDIMNDHG
ncbi:MAG: arginine repressor [Clostridiales bacterium]|jgi:transcriptional regulator of arginine metabolism|nr:arginine repressor [Clostridiales bacterium]